MVRFFLLIVLLSSSALWAETNQLGLGAMLGNPTGLSAKYWLSDNRALDGGLGLSLGKRADLNLHSDYLLHNKEAFFFNDVNPLDLYYGIGARIKFADDIRIGVRVPVGLAYQIKEKSADLFGEIAPVIDIISSRGLEIHIALGARYYF